MNIRNLIHRLLRQKSPAERYLGISANCLRHPHAARCLCNRCNICIEEETGMTLGALTYAAKPDSGLLMCNSCLAKYGDRDLTEHYARFSAEYWQRPVSPAEVEKTLIRKPSTSSIRRYREGGRWITEITDLKTGSRSRSW